MIHYASILVGAAAGAFYLRERRARLAIERLGAVTLETLLDTIDANNPVTGAHVRRVADFSLILAESADCDERMQRSVERIALFHDIGKIDGALSDIINESSTLTPGERKAIRTHPRRGADVLRPLAAFYPDLPEGVLSHHERWDGTGYPRCLRGSHIPLAARIVAIADTFDAVTHSRSYRHARSAAKAVDVISCGRGTQFDPDLVDLFLAQPVMDQIMAAMRKAMSPQRRGGNRRSQPARANAPDITFRWRTRSPSRQPVDQ